jgi:hypothetical protein
MKNWKENSIIEWCLLSLCLCLTNSCNDHISVNSLAGGYVALEHCEKDGVEYLMDRNSFKLERIGLKNLFRFYPSTPDSLYVPGEGFWKGMEATAIINNDYNILEIRDSLSGFWSGEYTMNFEKHGDVSYLELESNERYLLLENANPLLYQTNACRGCVYITTSCGEEY